MKPDLSAEEHRIIELEDALRYCIGALNFWKAGASFRHREDYPSRNDDDVLDKARDALKRTP